MDTESLGICEVAVNEDEDEQRLHILAREPDGFSEEELRETRDK